MGVKGLTSLLQKVAPGAVTSQSISHYRDKTLAVDVSCYLNRFIYGSDPHPARVQHGVHRLCLYLQLNGIRPIFVFDGPGRIIEKRREAQKRQTLQEKAEKSFQLEKIRKSRLMGLEGSTELLQGYSSEQIASILEDIQLRDNFSIGPKQQQDMIISSQQQEGLVVSPESLVSDTTAVVDVVSAEGLKTTVAILNHDWESDMDSRKDLDFIYVLSDSMENSGDHNRQPVLGTGVSTQRIMSSCGLPQLEATDSSDTFHEAKIKKKVHEALENFVQSMEGGFDVGVEDLTENTTRRQRELNQLEKKLLQGIKEKSRMNRGKKASKQQHLEALVSAEKRPLPADFVKEMDTEDNVMMANVPEEERKAITIQGPGHFEANTFQMMNDQRMEGTIEEISAVTDNEFKAKDDELIDDVAKKPSAVIEAHEAKDDALIDDTTSEIPIERQSGLMEDMQDQSLSDSSLELMQDNKPLTDSAMEAAEACKVVDMGAESAAETVQDSDLQSMINDILSVHRSVFTTLERRALRVTWPLVESCQQLLKAMGQPVVQAYDAEAEAVCARLTSLGWADASVSEDTDTAVFGNGLLLRQVGIGSGKEIIEINPLQAHAALGLNRDAFRDMCILCGTDFSGTIEGIGPSGAVKLIQRYGSIESIMVNINNRPRVDFMYDLARRVFDRTPNVPTRKEAYQTKPEIQPMLQKLLSKYEIDHDEIVNEILKEIEAETMGASTDPFAASSLGVDPFKEFDVREM
ncbi:Flap endonuclease GEN 1 [Modicella reniformis]|uniref:Flap endonuclease GEN 1 n=1 Tax=Modicella reniformis TaxID=1440133 RepID=A0A9P6SNR3_9FUNG|nr:Flap endonuclease GEN 1 [Modicella reniformis]